MRKLTEKFEEKEIADEAACDKIAGEIVCENIYGVQMNSEICEENFKSQEELLDYMLEYYLEKCF